MSTTAKAPSDPAREGVLTMLRHTPRPARFLLGGVLLNQLGAFVHTFLVLYLVQAGVSAQQAGAALGAYGIGGVLGLLVGGELTQRLGARATIVSAMGVSGLLVVSIPALAAPGRFTGLLVVVALAGAVTQSYRPAAATLLSELLPDERRVMGFSMFRVAMNVGAAIGPLLAAAVILVDWDLLFWIDGATALGYALVAALFLPGGRRAADRTATDAAAQSSAGAAYAQLLTDRRFLLYLAAMLLSAVVYVQFYAVLPLKIEAAGHPASVYSIVLATSSVLLITLELKVTAHVGRWRAAVAAGVGTTVFALGMLSLGLPGDSAVLIVLATVVAISGVMVSGPTMWAHPATTAIAVRSRYIAASQAIFGVGSAVGPVLGVWMWTRSGDGVWLACGLVGLASAGLAVLGMREDSSPVPDAVPDAVPEPT